MSDKTSYTISKVIKRFGDFRYKLVAEGVLVGIVVGLVVVFFRLALEFLESFLSKAVEFAGSNPWFIPVWFAVLTVAAGVTTLLLKWEPMISGSGIPQLDGEIQGYFQQKWWRVLIAKIAGGIITIGCGLSLGREGPSIQLGAMVGKGFSRIAKRMRTEEKFLITCGASAGLSAAFNAPIAGALFALEEVHKNFSVEVLLSSMAASVTSDFISRNVFGLRPVFDFSSAVAIPLSHIWIVVLVGLACGLLGIVYNRSIAAVQTLYEKIPSLFIRIWIPFLLAGMIFVFFPIVLGGGNSLVMQIAEGFPLKLLILILVVKFFFSLISFGSGAPGGIFLPMLVLGSLCGAVLHGVFAQFGMDLNLQAMLILSMAGAFSAIVRAPVTGILLITEMTGNFSHLMFIALTSLIAFTIADLFHTQPIYEQLLRRMMLKFGKLRPNKSGEKVLLEATVCHGAPICNKPVNNVNMPEHCLIISVKRGEEEIVPQGDTILLSGDILVILCDEYDSAGVSYALEKQCKICTK